MRIGIDYTQPYMQYNLNINFYYFGQGITFLLTIEKII